LRHAHGIGLAIALACAVGCATGGIVHEVQPGENLYRIGQAYGYDHLELARLNRIPPPYAIRPGDEIYIPDADRQLPVNVITPRSVDAAPPTSEVAAGADTRRPVAPLPGGPEARGYATNARFVWPVRGPLLRPFGGTGSARHDGIDIGGGHGTAIFAAADGKVIFSDRLSSYGNVIIVEHAVGFTTVYAHNDRNLVRKGARVRRGERIAELGASGRAKVPHLHFEVRKDNVARNPLYYLPR
jgi:murein DD-endopeptidase MepM/ murein hydrolase activator NlpD